jgi:Protein kinase domain
LTSGPNREETAVPESALTEALRRWDPEQVGGFVLLGRLGCGAMGRVYLGRSAAGRLVAVKTIKAELADEPEFRTRFAQEVAAARRVSGAFTAPVVAADAEADVPWLATTYVPAPALNRLVRACGPLPAAAVRWLAAGCAEALASIHNAGLVHRDLKPSNVLVAPDGPRVIDFGVARAAERIQLTVTRGAVGTPAYMAPEQARDTRQATVASDVFSLGATMLFAATGHAPYQGETVMDVLVRLATEPPDLTGLPADLTDIVVGCLDRDPRRRPTSASVLARLAPTITAPDDGREPGPASLPGCALALIAEYRREPRPPGADAGDQEDATGVADATFGSQPARGKPGGLSSRRRGRRPGRPRGRLVLLGAALALAVALVGAGTAIGAGIAASPSPRDTPRPDTFLPPGGPGPGPGPVSAARPGRPQLSLNQGQGDGDTVFVVHGQGWPPARRVTVALAGLGASPVHPIVDGAGTFSYAIDQGHVFFPGTIPLGSYRVVVTGAGGLRAEISFVVDHRLPPRPHAS